MLSSFLSSQHLRKVGEHDWNGSTNPANIVCYIWLCMSNLVFISVCDEKYLTNISRTDLKRQKVVWEKNPVGCTWGLQHIFYIIQKSSPVFCHMTNVDTRHLKQGRWKCSGISTDVRSRSSQVMSFMKHVSSQVQRIKPSSSLSHPKSPPQMRRIICKVRKYSQEKKKVLTQIQTPCDKRGTCYSLGRRRRGRRRSHWQSLRSASTVYGPLCLKVHPRRRLRTSSPNTQCYLETGIETRRKSKTSWKRAFRTGQLRYSPKPGSKDPKCAGPGDCAICIIFETMRTPLFLFYLGPCELLRGTPGCLAAKCSTYFTS